MRGVTHLLVAAVLGFLLLQSFSFSHPLFFFLLFCFASLLPDVDHPGSLLGKRLWPFSSLIAFFFGHRGFVHSLFLPLFFLGIFWYFDFLWIGVALAGGYMTHLFVDAFTLHGIRPFWFGPRIKGILKSGGFVEWILFFLLLFVLFWLLFF